jgi:N utilization substance protein A
MPTEETELVRRLFAQEVPEIAQGIVEIKAVARKPGVRTKLVVHSHDPGLDAVAACTGERGSRMSRIVDQLGCERIDVIRWHESLEELVTRSLQPAVISEVIVQPAEHRAVVVMTADKLSAVKNLPGWSVNQELAGRLCGCEIAVVAQ